jgi:hypothetical protein
MATPSNVLTMLIPNGGWVIVGDEYEDIKFLECETITKTEYLAGFANYDNWKANEAEAKAAAKAALLAQLGITEEQAKLLLS